MITEMVTNEMIKEWKQIFKIHSASMKSNRKSGEEVDAYFKSNYSYELFDSPEFTKVVELNITQNEHSRQKLSDGKIPHVNTYRAGDVLVGIDLTTGEFHVESKDIEKAIPIYDDLFVFRGLDQSDLKNFVLVGEYINLSKK